MYPLPLNIIFSILCGEDQKSLAFSSRFYIHKYYTSAVEQGNVLKIKIQKPSQLTVDPGKSEK